MLGAEGVGLLGLLATGLTLAVTLFSFGLASSGVRYVARAKESSETELLHTRSALFYGSQLLGLVGGLLFVLFRVPLASLILADSSKAAWVVWLGVALWASVAAGGQLAVINGLRRIGDLAKANLWGAALGTVATLVAISLSGDIGLVAAIVAPPLTTWLAAWWLSRDIATAPLRAYGTLWRPLRSMLSLGVVFAASSVLTGAAQFVSRLVVERALDLTAVGHFQAAWSVSNIYLSFVLTALAAEYYPRISALADDKGALNEAVDAQLKLALLLAGPVILGMILFAPWAVTLLYSSTFSDTVAVLRWQLVGDVLKVAAWAVGFLLLAREARWPFFVSELVWNALYVGTLFFLRAYLRVGGGGRAVRALLRALFGAGHPVGKARNRLCPERLRRPNSRDDPARERIGDSSGCHRHRVARLVCSFSPDACSRCLLLGTTSPRNRPRAVDPAVQTQAPSHAAGLTSYKRLN